MRWLLILCSCSCFAVDRYIATTGANVGNCSDIDSPCLTMQYVNTQFGPGDRALMRGGTYTSASNMLAPSVTCTEAAPCTFQAYPGELVRISGSGGSIRFFVTLPSNTYGSHYRFVGLKFIDWSWDDWPVLSQGQHPGIQFIGCYIQTETGFLKFDQMTDGSGVKILGSQFVMGHGITCTIDDAGADDDYSGTCPAGTTYLLLNTQAQNTGAATLDIGDGTGPHAIKLSTGGDPSNAYFQGSGHGFRMYWNATNSTWVILTATLFECAEWTGTANGDYAGCTDILVQDSIFDRKGSSSDFFASAGRGGNGANGNGLIERVSVRSTNAVADCVDWKYTGVTVNWMEVFGCRAKGLGVWGYSKWSHLLTDSASTFIGGQLSGYISNAVDDGGYIKLTRSSNVGQGPFPGLRITIAGVNGCSGANGTFRILDGVSTYTFRIMTDAGGATTCGGAYTSSTSSTIRMAAPASGTYGGDVEYSTAVRSGGLPGIWATDGADIPTRAIRNIFANTNASTGAGFIIGMYNSRTSGDNQFYSARGAGYACDYSSNGSVHRCDLLPTWEPDSHNANPQTTTYDAATYRPFSGALRATASSPATIANRGYYSGTNSATGGEGRMVVRFRAPAATDACTVVLDDSSDFGSLVETVNSAAGPQWREVVFGVSTPLSASTTYYHRITCGYDVFTGSAATMASTAGTTSATVSLGTPADASQTQAAVDYSTDNSDWTAGTPGACSTGCTLTAASLERGQVYWLRTRRVSAGGATLATSEARAALIP